MKYTLFSLGLLSFLFYPINMSIETWGMMPKSQEDAQTVEERVAEMIAEHEADPEAHTGENESLAAHREFGILDHLAGSVKADKFAFSRKINCAFESLDAYTKSGTYYLNIAGLHVRAGNVAGNVSYVFGYVDAWAPLSFDYSWLFEANALLVTTTGNESRIGIGSTAETDGSTGIGFKIVGTTLYAYHIVDINTSPVETAVSLGAFTPTVFHNYRIIYDHTLGEIRFYLDGDLVHTFTTGLPTAEDYNIAVFQVKSTTSAYHSLKISDYHYSTDPI